MLPLFTILKSLNPTASQPACLENDFNLRKRLSRIIKSFETPTNPSFHRFDNENHKNFLGFNELKPLEAPIRPPQPQALPSKTSKIDIA